MFLRHPADVPIECRSVAGDKIGSVRTSNIGQGGICFRSSQDCRAGARVTVRIPVCEPVFEAEGTVVWCHWVGECYEMGVRFEEEDVRFGLRMVEQVCQIEHYRRQVLEHEGRRLSAEEAAREWIGRRAADFPRAEE